MDSARPDLHANTAELYRGLTCKRAQPREITTSNRKDDYKWNRGKQTTTPYIKEDGFVENQVEAEADRVEVEGIHVEAEVGHVEVEVEVVHVEVEVDHVEVEVGHVEVEVEVVHVEVEVGRVEVDQVEVESGHAEVEVKLSPETMRSILWQEDRKRLAPAPTEQDALMEAQLDRDLTDTRENTQRDENRVSPPPRE